ncbi:MAG: hypothetical protein JWN26_598 [Candidatus Saccharibacteria bacterium]|nr:hypothetical protein [Candidatus Saccharibacteria bacterium]
MNESENSTLQRPLGIDSEGNLLTEERREERLEQVRELMKRASDLRVELDEIMSRIYGSVKEHPANVSQLVNGAHDIRAELLDIKDQIGHKTSTRYPAIKDVSLV